MRIRQDIRRALESYKAHLQRYFGPRLVRVALFGSRARGEAREDSDVDVLVLIEGSDFQEEREAAMLAGDVAVEEADSAVTPEHLRQAIALEAERAEQALKAAEMLHQARFFYDAAQALEDGRTCVARARAWLSTQKLL